MQRFVINLDKSRERMAWMDTAFRQMKLEYARVPAIDGQALSREEKVKACLPRTDGLSWTDGEIGVFLSHRECWKKITWGEDKYGAVFEDDLHFATNAADFLTNPAWIPVGTDLVKLETYAQETMIDKAAFPVCGHKLARLRTEHWGAGAYIISRKLAGKLLQRTFPLTDQVDVVLFDPTSKQCDFAIYQLVPSICIQDLILRKKRSQGYLASIIGDQRDPLRRKKCKPRGIRKLQREIFRPFLRLAHRINILRFNLLSDRKIMKIPFLR